MPKHQLLTLVDALQKVHNATLQVIESDKVGQSPLKVIAFESIEEFVIEFRSDQYIGFMQPAMKHHTLAFGIAGGTTKPYSVAFHEFTHFVSRSHFEFYVPLWYEEGFAQYIGNARLAGDSVILGEIRPRQMIRALKRHKDQWRNILDGIPRLDWHHQDYEEHYEFAHGVVHYMHHGKTADGMSLRDVVPDMLRDISQRKKASHILPEYSGVSDEEFIDHVIEHFKSNPPDHRIQVDKSTFSNVEDARCLEPIETRKLLASVLARKNPARAFEHAQFVIDRAPQDPDVNVILSYLPEFDELSSYERTKLALDYDPQHADANVRMGDLYSYNCLDIESDECDMLRELATQHYRIALQQQPSRVDAAFGLGVSLLRTSRAGDALNYLRVSYQRLPWNSRINLFLGEAYRNVGDRARAVDHLKRAALWEDEPDMRERAEILLEEVTSAETSDS